VKSNDWNKLILIVLITLLVGFFLNTKPALETTNKLNPFEIAQETHDYVVHKLPDTDLQVTVPRSFEVDEERRVGMHANVTPNINLTKKGYVHTFVDDKPRTVGFSTGISFYTIKTALSPVEWLSANVSFQSQKSDVTTWETWVKEKAIAGFDVVITHTSCCGGYTPTYLFNTQNALGEDVLVIYTTSATEWVKPDREDGNYLLDYLLSSTQETTNSY